MIAPLFATGRFTPTRVGKMAPGRSFGAGWSVHPHARGEDDVTWNVGAGHRGSPPRAWGRFDGVDENGQPIRFTPTRVGKMDPCSGTPRSDSVHPHARGEDGGRVLWAAGVHGSPPRAWGRLRPGRMGDGALRFTPTRVGKIFIGSFDGSNLTVHPHARGEDSHSRGVKSTGAGSPPRAWGRLLAVPQSDVGVRFTPTRVGKMPSGSGCTRQTPVHPHARGEDKTEFDLQLPGNGSPPRAWGR